MEQRKKISLGTRVASAALSWLVLAFFDINLPLIQLVVVVAIAIIAVFIDMYMIPATGRMNLWVKEAGDIGGFITGIAAVLGYFVLPSDWHVPIVMILPIVVAIGILPIPDESLIAHRSSEKPAN